MRSNVASQFVGTWRLISCSAVTPDGVTTHPFGMYAQGRLTYEAGGRMAVQIARPGQSSFASGDPRLPTDAEARAAYDRYMAYYGTYTVDEDNEVVVHHVEVSLTPDWAGTDQRRHYSLEGKRLTLTTRPALFGGAERVTTLVWEKLP
jgi:hypothetical protein